MEAVSKPKLLVISQTYVPDPASVGQHMADAAEAMADRGYEVRVLTSARGYEDPRVTYPSRERRAGVEVVRLPFSSFGKRSLAHRIVGQALFILQVIVRGVFTKRLAGVLVSTSPPMGTFAALVISFVRRVPLTYWLMDLNPDQAIALGTVSRRSPLVWCMKCLNRRVFNRAAGVVVLDRLMAEGVQRQYHVRGRLEIVPPWPHIDAGVEDRETRRQGDKENPFVAEHGLEGRFVVMYSGNHSPASPVTTLVQAALGLGDDPRFVFLFIGGGLGKHEVDEVIAAQRPPNILSLPYQPLDRIKYSLSAADLHVVTLGNEMAGIIHPCKVYGAMAVGRPVLLVGPRPSHAAELIERHAIGWQVNHGDVTGMVEALRRVAQLPRAELVEIGDRARAAVRSEYSKLRLCAAFCDVIEKSLRRVPAAAAAPAEAA